MMIKIVCILLFLYFKNADLTCFDADNSLSNYSYRLPNDVIPIEYTIFIQPDLEKGTYKGTVDVSVETCKNTNIVTLHSKNLKILYSSINGDCMDFSFNETNDFLILFSDKKLLRGNVYKLKIEFEGDMKNKTYGFFRGSDENNNKKVHFGATFFEPQNARTAFPCFDEPNLKAQFTIQIVRPLGYVALSNTKIKSVKKNVVEFHTTPRMSTYLVSFFIGKYNYVEQIFDGGNNSQNIPLRVYAPPNEIKNAVFAVKQMPIILKWFNDYTAFEYPLEKLDVLLINPQFHVEGGMEDWGLISIRSTVMLLNIKKADQSDKIRVALSLAHEMAHLWFGDLVTLNFWNEFWLNEGFARLFDMKAADAYPAVKYDKAQGIASNLNNVLWFDDDLGSAPLIRNMKEPKNVYDILNIIPYNKGSSILLMIEDVISPKTFQAFIQCYIQKFKYKNVSTKDIIETLQSFIKYNSTQFLSGWAKQSGYPLITVDLKNGTVTFMQKRFLRMNQVENHETKWTVPIKYITDVSQKPEIYWLNENDENATMDLPNVNWIKLNHNFGGYYRVYYPKSLRKYFADNMMSFSIEDRMNLLDDSFALVRSGHLQCDEALEYSTFVKNELNSNVWIVAQNIFQMLKTNFPKHGITLDNLKKYVSKIVDPPYKQVGWIENINETYQQVTARVRILSIACAYDHWDCLNTVNLLKNKRDSLSVSIRRVVLRYGNFEKRTPKRETLDVDRDLSKFFGADVNDLTKENIFVWPVDVLDNCNRWLEKNYN